MDGEKINTLECNSLNAEPKVSTFRTGQMHENQEGLGTSTTVLEVDTDFAHLE